MMFNLLINPTAIPKGEALKYDAVIRIGNAKLYVPQEVKQLVQSTGISLGHKIERETVVHLLNAIAFSAKSDANSNGTTQANTGEVQQ